MYSFVMSYKELNEARRDVDWPKKGLVVDALERGNMARFINDKWGQDGRRKPNVVAKVFWSTEDSRPYIMLYAATKIEPGDELLLSYGKNYWVFFARNLQRVHYLYYRQTSREVAALHDWVRRVEGEERLAALTAEMDAAKVDIPSKLVYDE
ncbi:hypothetical protein TSOC_000953 [Tetrabaena socialis]|uniref:SET domain-containing protein n=1 Tax=Tetrabaena socialis TaxID=47790 RepID=A0A2J8AI10_9CHLO|nr:hypothetical protein TSOC_000953 [Tetrabaena socialis]|eukprot:PNH12147.1 hypothetical protein TSOC_000953 [Tetrabaena socialis]